MDKIAANNHFVSMRKEIKKAKAMVSGNLIRKMKEHKLEKEKLEDETSRKKIDGKIDKILKETKLLKTIDSYEIAKHATLKPDPTHWNKIICDSKASAEQVLEARIVIKNNVQKCVVKFRTDNKDCDEWLNEYIEYREKKRDLMQATKPFKRKDRRSQNDPKRSLRADEQKGNSTDRSKIKNRSMNKHREVPSIVKDQSQNKAEVLHPSWESKRKEKELLKAALAGGIEGSKRITFS